MGGDLTDEAAAKTLWREAVAWQGRIDVLVNNAAVYEAEPAFADDDAWPVAWREVWQRTLQLNLLAPAELATRAVAHFRERGEGGILIHLSSRAAHRGEKPLLGSYAASKGAFNALSHTLAAPTVARNPLLRGGAGLGRHRHVVGLHQRDRRSRPARRERARHADPPEEVANIVTFLASGAARHATGTVIDINGASFPR